MRKVKKPKFTAKNGNPGEMQILSFKLHNSKPYTTLFLNLCGQTVQLIRNCFSRAALYLTLRG
jgi:hypothetical protein